MSRARKAPGRVLVFTAHVADGWYLVQASDGGYSWIGDAAGDPFTCPEAAYAAAIIDDVRNVRLGRATSGVITVSDAA